MSKQVKISKGLDIKLLGEADKILGTMDFPDTVAIKPSDFEGVTPKMLVKEGAEVKAGTPLFYDKNNEKVKFCSPVSGEVAEIKRGAKRKILAVIILADRETRYEQFTPLSGTALNREAVKKQLLDSGAWAFIRQRPYNIIANPDMSPKSIFISAFDTAPMAPDYDYVLHAEDENFQAGLDALATLTDGKIHLNIDGSIKADDVFLNAKNVQINKVSGPHPAGDVGPQIHHLDPLSKGDTIWTINPQDVCIIGKLFLKGVFDASRTIALTGSEVKEAKYYKTIIGASLKKLLSEKTDGSNNRYISGNVLTGSRIEQDGYLGFYSNQVTVIPEGGDDQFFGWITPNLDRFSASRTMFSWMMPNKKYVLDASMNGEPRPFVMTGEYDKVFPFDIYPVQLLKAIIINDIELMEELGIYEVVPEDFALCETICTSKIPSQSIVRDGIAKLRKEMS